MIMLSHRVRRSFVALVMLGAATVPVATTSSSAAASPRVLRVGSWQGKAGEFTTIEDAVNAAQPGDWVLVGPGDYHEQMDHRVTDPALAGGAVLIDKPGLHLRGMDRNATVVDGTVPGSPQCSSAPSDQDLGPSNGGNPLGRNGVLVLEADGVSVDNLTACNFLNGDGGGGNAIWWNGGDGTGTQNLASLEGSYLSATSSYWEDGRPRSEYGIFLSNVTGPALVSHTYANNQADAAYYIGACPDCNTVLDDAHGQGSALGYSGTNSGGRLIVQNSEFDQNNTGFSTNSQNNADAPSPQDGICPAGLTGPTGTSSCWVFRQNNVHDNNNVNVPGSGSAELGPPGAGMVISGGRNDTVVDNTFSNNGSWAVLVAPFIDTGTPPPVSNCDGGVDNWLGTGWCYYGDWGTEVTNNTFVGNGGYGNPTNGDLADLSDLHDPGNCWYGNLDANGVSTAPPDLELTNGVCGVPNQGADVLGSDLSNQVICATGIIACPLDPPPNYPVRTNVAMMPLPVEPTMPDPCAGVPENPWCPASSPVTTPGENVAVIPEFTG
jgi:hypothetical protein